MTIQEILYNSRNQLIKPFGEATRKLVITLNLSYLFFTTLYIIADKIATGVFFQNIYLFLSYLLLSSIAVFSATYHYSLIYKKNILFFIKIDNKLPKNLNLEILCKWTTVCSLALQTFLSMVGFGDPHNDTILIDFALGFFIIFYCSLLLGRKATFFWFLIMLLTLFYVTYKNGYDYQFNYLTPDESARYELALRTNKAWALEREAILKKSGLYPPQLSRYFNEWLYCILGAFFISYFFIGIAHDIFKTIPSLSDNLTQAIYKHLEERTIVEEERLKLQKEALNAELNFLKSQLNPHFLYNTLNYFYIKSYDYSEELAESIRKLSDIMRYSLNSTELVTDLQEEIDCVKMLIALHQVRFENKLSIVFYENNNYKKEILPLILITLVENAFKHGILNDTNIPLLIKLETTETEIIFEISNKISQRKSKKSTSLGLQNIRNRLDLYYKDNAKLEISNNDIIYSCKLTIKSL